MPRLTAPPRRLAVTVERRRPSNDGDRLEMATLCEGGGAIGASRFF